MLAGDVAGADDAEALRQRFELEDVVGGDAMLLPRDVDDGGRRARRNEDCLGGHLCCYELVEKYF